jgi:biopolymer transport protein ExbB
MFDYIIESLQSGGWVIIPIILTSVSGWYLGLKLYLTLDSLSLKSGRLRKRIVKPASLIAWVRTMKPRDQKTMVGAVLRNVYRVRKSGETAMLEKLDEELKFYYPEIEKGLTTLAIMGGISPLLGLLGTVSGMVGTFKTISLFGAGNPALMADSISEALVTTQNGLLAALPLMLLHNFLSSRSEKLEKETLKSSQRLINYLMDRESTTRLRL